MTQRMVFSYKMIYYAFLKCGSHLEIWNIPMLLLPLKESVHRDTTRVELKNWELAQNPTSPPNSDLLEDLEKCIWVEASFTKILKVFEMI